MHGAYNKKDKNIWRVFKSIKLNGAFDIIGKALMVAYQIEFIINENQNFKIYWHAYKKMIVTMKQDPGIDFIQRAIQPIPVLCTKFKDRSRIWKKCFLVAKFSARLLGRVSISLGP